MIKSAENIKEVAISNAIIDFSENCRLFQTDSVFYVTFLDSVYSSVSKRTDEGIYIMVKDKYYEGVVEVGIIADSHFKFYYSGKPDDKLPSKFIIKSGKLFYWWDEGYPVTDETISILRKYNLLQQDLMIPEFIIDDSKKGADYYFCLNDLSKYKRVITNKGEYKPPKLKCK